MGLSRSYSGVSYTPNRRLVLQPQSTALAAYDSSDYGCSVTQEASAGLSGTTPVSGTLSLQTGGIGGSFTKIAPGLSSTPLTHFEIGSSESAFIEFFIYLNSLPGSQQHIFGASDAGANSWEFGTTGANALQWYNGSSGARTTSFTFTAATWHWVVLDIRNGSGNTVCYVNGSAVDTVTSHTTALTNATGLINVGDAWSAWGQCSMYFQGRIHIGENHPNPTGSAPTTPWDAVENVV